MGYDNNLRLLEIATGAESGTWGTKTNTNLGLIADAFGYATKALTTNTDAQTLTIEDGTSTDAEARSLYLKITGALDSVPIVTLAPNDAKKVWIIENATTDSGSSGPYGISIKQGAGAGAAVTIGNGKVAVVYTDGGGSGAIVYDAFADLELSSTLIVAGNVDFNGDLDVDGITNLDVVDIDGAVDMASTLGVTGTSTLAAATLSGNLEVAKAAAKVIVDSSSTASVDIDRSATTEGAKVNFQTAGSSTWTIGMQDSDDWGDGTPFFMGTGSSASSAKFVLNTSGVVTLGTVTPEVLYTLTPKLQVETTGSDAGLSAFRNENGAGGPYLFLGKSRGTAVNSDTIVQDDDVLGSIMFVAADGVDRGNAAASIIAYIDGTPGENDTPGRLQFNTSADGSGSPTTRMTILSDGKVGLGTATPDAHLEISAGDNAPTIKLSESDDTNKMLLKFASDVGEITVIPDKVLQFKNNNTTRMSIAVGGAVNVAGAFSKGSGSFRIDHPLPEKKDTHYLVHSFIEGPKADLIYRGTVDLSGGYAQVDLDDAAGMTEGTWELLCRDPQCWIQNDSGWDAVRGSVEGNTLTVECEETDSDDTVSWMVVAERCDPHIMETDWTDEDGHVIVEPEKPEPEEEEE